MNQAESIRISILIPVYNGSSTLPDCLHSLFRNNLNEAEVIVINDHSTDDSPAIAARMGARVLDNPRGRGPAAARNFGAENAKGTILFFVDADVVVRDDTVSEVLQAFDEAPQIAAVFGSYDDDPARKNFLSQYKNMLHHYVHQQSKEEASTFWAGCGAIRKEVFKAMGGFDELQYTKAQIEDIELGVRLWNEGHSIRLRKSLQVKHLKRWTPIGLLKADILYRAIPWSRLILQNRRMPSELNLLGSHRLSALLVGVLALVLVILPIAYFQFGLSGSALYALLVSIPVILLLLVWLNRKLYGFFLSRRGFLFTLGAIFWHLLYYFYSGTTFVICWFYHKLRNTPPQIAATTRKTLSS